MSGYIKILFIFMMGLGWSSYQLKGEVLTPAHFLFSTILNISTMEKETWKDVVGYEGLYQVSNIGRVRCLDREVKVLTRWGNYTTRHIKGQVILLSNHSCGYMSITLSKDNIKTTHVVHRLVATSFILNPKDKKQVNHKDCNKTNNRVDNLEWVTCSENHKHAYKNGLKRSPKVMLGKFGIEHPKSIAVQQCDLHDNMISEFGSMSEAERGTGISKTNISTCCSGKQKTAGGYIWKLKT